MGARKGIRKAALAQGINPRYSQRPGSSCKGVKWFGYLNMFWFSQICSCPCFVFVFVFCFCFCALRLSFGFSLFTEIGVQWIIDALLINRPPAPTGGVLRANRSSPSPTVWEEVENVRHTMANGEAHIPSRGAWGLSCLALPWSSAWSSAHRTLVIRTPELSKEVWNPGLFMWNL